MVRLFLLASALLAFTACGDSDPAGPTINTLGDGNCINVVRGSHNTCSTPPPVVVTPVFAPEPTPEPEA